MDSQHHPQPSSQEPGWKPISNDEVRDWRKTLPKGHIREYDTAHTVGLPAADHEGDEAFFQDRRAPVIDDPRRVVADMKEQIINWATQSREAAKLAVTIMRNSNPEAHKNRTDDELIDMLVGHLEESIEEATRSVYRDEQNKWDKGRLVDVKDGIWRP